MKLSSLALLALVFSTGVFAQESPCSGSRCGLFAMSDELLAQDLGLLEKLVNMPSETSDIAGVTKVVAVVRKELEGLGFKSSTYVNPIRDSSGTPISADLLVAELAGKDPTKFITIIGHADTVFKAKEDGSVPVPYQVVDAIEGPVQIPIAGKRIVGSGVGDDKGGVVVMLRALKLFLALGKPQYSLRVILSTNEESGSPGHQVKMGEFAKDSIAVFGLEPSATGNVLKARGGVHWYHIAVTGKEGHAGIMFERGVNACVDLSIKLQKAVALADPANNTTVSVGTISGGKRSNIICGSAEAVLDTRFPSAEMNRFLEEQITAIALKPEVFSLDGEHTPSQSEIKTTAQSPTFETTAESAPYIDSVLKRIREIDSFPARAGYSRGGADISFLKPAHAVMIDSLGPATDGSHSPQEYVILETMRSRALVFADLLSQFR